LRQETTIDPVVRKLSFQLKILLSFALIILLTVGLGLFFVNVTVDRAFANFTLRELRRHDVVVARFLEEYYRHTGGWEGLDRLIGRQHPYHWPFCWPTPQERW
jgi:hypothetical protein